MMSDSPGGPGSKFNPFAAAPSRTYAALQGANDAYAADRKAVAELRQALTGVDVDEVAQENLAALGRAVKHLARQGYTQFADFGGGRPMQRLNKRKLPDLTTVAEAEQPERRWLLLDSDLTAITAGRALLGGPGVAVVQGDLRDVPAVLAALHDHLDMRGRPVMILGAVLHFLTMQEARVLLDALWEHLAPGSVAVATHLFTAGVDPVKVTAGTAAYKAAHGIDIYPRTREEITSLAGRFTLREPGVVQTTEFMPEPGPPSEQPHFLMWLATRE
ncbi:SAM-dependent methyltransferase [Nonomuraea sp. KM90]|uniref:SAM-dependent methyltransferase n=1 Tax=Nonomuraea sp. KM90 TaxID=3457428 RepID=UPI003FCC4F24